MTVRQMLPGRHRTVVELLRAAAEANADVEALVEPWEGRGSVTFGAWDRAADGVAGMLADRGVVRGDVVCLVLPSSIDYAVCYAAAARLGAVTSGVNPRMGPAEVASVVERAAPVVTVADPALGVALPAGGAAGEVVARVEAHAAWEGPAPRRQPSLHDDDPVAVVWTSGTTGRPKGAVFDHRCLAAVSEGADALSRPGDRRLSPLPFAHVGSMTKVWDEIAHGITTVITPTPWRAAEALAVMASERVTVGQGVPTQWQLVLALDELDHTDLSSLRIVGTGAAPMPASQVAELRRRLGVPVVVRYASTETAICTGTRPDDPDRVVATTVGRPVPGVALSVVDQDGREVGTGCPGRVRIRSRATFCGYWNGRRDRRRDRRRGEPPRGTAHLVDEAATAPVRSPDGWVTTGDVGVVGEDGNLRLVGREQERYIRGGYNVYPVEVEDVLAGHPAVARAAVVGAPDPVLGEVGVAFVVPAAGAAGDVPAGDAAGGGAVAVPDLQELRAFCAERLADYKAPDVVVVLDALPLTPMMKVDKRSLAAPARAAAAGRQVGRGPEDGKAGGNEREEHAR
ncbi:MAG: class I adenylate-forming enzyme family protein [Acidimicrobiales bacterium]